MLISYNNVVFNSGVSIVHSTEVAGFEAENVQALQPSEFFRSSVLNPAYIQASTPVSTRVLSAIGVGCTRHRNMCPQSNELDTTWTATNVAVVQRTTQFAYVPGASYSWSLTDDATSGEHSLVMNLGGSDFAAAPSTYANDGYFTTAFYVKQWTGDLDVRLRLYESGSNYAECSFDLSAGTSGTASTTGNLANASGSIEVATAADGGSGWYRVALTAQVTSGVVGSIEPHLYLEDAGAISYSGSGDAIYAMCCTMENGTKATVWSATTTDTAAFYSINGNGSSTTIASYRHVVDRDLTDAERLSIHYVDPVGFIAPAPRLNIFDPNNLNGYVDIGVLYVGQVAEIDAHLEGYQVQIQELGGEARARGGERYRGIHPRTKAADFELAFLSRDDAYGKLWPIYEALGGSMPGVFIADESETSYSDAFSIYGFISGDHPIARQVGLVWQTSFLVEEVV